MIRSLMKVVYVILAAGLTLAAAADQTVHLNRVMREKLGHSQKILEAVVTSNWTALDQHSRALQRLADDPAWAVLMTPEYVRHTSAFTRASQDLRDAARDHDLDAAPLAYVSLTMSCVQCHRYVARARIAK